MNSCSDTVQLVLVLFATLVLAVRSQNYDVYSYNFDEQPNRIPNVADRPAFNPQQNFAQQPNFPREQQPCDSMSAVHRDQNGPYGSITISNPDYQNIVIRAVYSVAARLPSVRPRLVTSFFQRKKLAWNFPLELFYRADNVRGVVEKGGM